MKLTTANLELLAKAYGAKPTQLAAPPEAAELVAKLDEVQQIIDGMEPDDLRHWFEVGRRMKRSR